MTEISGLLQVHPLDSHPQQGGLHAAPKGIVGQTGATTRLEANTKKGCGERSGFKVVFLWRMLTCNMTD